MIIISEIVLILLVSAVFTYLALKRISSDPENYFNIHFQLLIYKLGVFLVSIVVFSLAFTQERIALILSGLITFISSHFLEGFIIQKQLLKLREMNGR
ncbi:MAG: hypothetical protein ACE5D7_01825 [Fidelibacterota bacterium]